MLGPYLDERQRRVFATSEALAAGWGGIAAVSRITRIARSTIGRGLDEVAVGAAPDGRVRRAGAGRKPLEAADPRLIEDLERIVTPTQRGDPEQPLRWTIKSLRQIARALHDLGHGISHTSARCCAPAAIAFRRTARPAKDRTIPTAMPSSSTSTRRSTRRWPGVSRGSRPTPT